MYVPADPCIFILIEIMIFDFTNDGAPDSITIQQNDFQIELENTYVKGATYAIKLSRFLYGENMAYKNLLTSHYKAHSGAKKFTNINYCFREQSGTMLFLQTIKVKKIHLPLV